MVIVWTIALNSLFPCSERESLLRQHTFSNNMVSIVGICNNNRLHSFSSMQYLS